MRTWLLYKSDEIEQMKQDMAFLIPRTRISEYNTPKKQYHLLEVDQWNWDERPLGHRLLCLAHVDLLLRGGSLPEPRTIWERLELT